MSFDFSNIDWPPVLVASIISLFIEIAWVRWYQKNKKSTILSFAMRFFFLLIFACGINLVCYHSKLIDNVKESIHICFLFVVPSLGLQALNDKQSFSNWFITTLYAVIQFSVLSSVMFGVIKLMNS